MTAQLQRFFKICDTDGTRSVDKDAFRNLCSRFSISPQDADLIFEDLDLDKDGKISFADFSRGFSEFIQTSIPDINESKIQKNSKEESCVEEEVTKNHVWSALTAEAERLGKKNSNEGKLKWLLEELQMSDQRHLVPYLESAVEELLENLQQLQEEKGQLEESWLREKQEHERHLKRMEEEMDSQVKEAEMKLRLQAQAEVEDERKSLQSKMDVEMNNLQAHLALFEKVNAWFQTHPTDNQDIRLDEVRQKLDEAVHENRQLRMSLLDTQTSIALMRSELLQLRTLYEEKCRELNNEREKILEVLHEQDHLSRQLNLLHDVNKRLQDTNDALRNSVDSPNSCTKWFSLGHSSRSKRGSVLGDYLDLGCSRSSIRMYPDDSDDEIDNKSRNAVFSLPRLRRAHSMDVNFPTKRKTIITNRRPLPKLTNQSDSGVSTSRDLQELDDTHMSSPISNCSSNSRDEDMTKMPSQNFRKSYPEQCTRPVSLSSSVSKPQEISKNSFDNQTNIATFEERRVKGSSSVGNLLDLEEFPKRRISDIIKELGINDTPVSWRRSKTISLRVQKSPESRCLSNNKTNTEVVKVSESCQSLPVPLPRTSKMLKMQPQRKIEENNSPSAVNGSLQETQLPSSEKNISELCRNILKPIAFPESVSSQGEEETTEKSESDEEQDYEPNGPAQQTFKVIFIGDAGVGKSSFALRLSKGVFVRNMSSTLGVDFLMRTIRVDGRNVAVQLWDTAGQERFRSITKSYFRKADGVMLLYDCTYEQSFLSVREWVEDVDSITHQRIPLMIVANKIDLREIMQRKGEKCISTEEGKKLAKECDTIFMEASAKDGCNVVPALANLVRAMSTHQELQISASTMHLSEVKPKKQGCCGKSKDKDNKD